MEYRTKNYIYYNAHPKGFKVKDCVVRAVSTGMDKDYMETRKWLNQEKRRLGFDSYTAHDFIRTWLENLGYETIKFKAISGQPRTKLYEFLKDHQEGTYICVVRKHVTCIKNGQLLDTWDCGYLTIYGAWRMQ